MRAVTAVPAPYAARARRSRTRGAGERGSQALEFAMVVPLLGVLLGLLAQTGLLLADVQGRSVADGPV